MGKILYLLSFLAIGELDVVSRKTNESTKSTSTQAMGGSAISPQSLMNTDLLTSVLNQYTNARKGAKLLALREDDATRWILGLDGRVFILFYTVHAEDSKMIYMRTSVPQPQPSPAKEAKGVGAMTSQAQMEWDSVCKQTCLSQELSIDCLQGETEFHEKINSFVSTATRLLEEGEHSVSLSCSTGEGAAQDLNFNQSMQQLIFSTIDL